MSHYFDMLHEDESERMFKAPILVSILIAGADGDIDAKEIAEAISFTEKEAKSKSLLAGYFREVAQDFEDKIKILEQSYPYGSEQRESLIIEELKELNMIIPKLDPEFAKQFYIALKTIAHKIATSSGGLLGINAVGSKEAKYIDLHMINNPSDLQ